MNLIMTKNMTNDNNRMPVYKYFLDENLQIDLDKHYETAWGLEKCTCYHCPPKALVARND